jgi:uncharacterized lipoprotein YddW (UPF0748 family)
VEKRAFGIGLVAICTIALALVSADPGLPFGPGQSTEVRALWVQRSTLTSPASISTLVNSAAGAGFNTLLVQVRGRGDAFYNSELEPRGAALEGRDLAFDPLAVTVAAAHRAGLRVHAWINMNLVSDATPPIASGHLVHTHPEWLMVPRELAEELASVNPRAPRYLATLSEFAHAHADTIEGLYMSAIGDAAGDHLVRVVSDIAFRYAVDGIHLDYFRYPAEDFDYSAAALAQFRTHMWGKMDRAERREYGRRAEGRLLFYTQMFPQQWQEFRRERLTRLLRRVRTAVKSKRPDMVLSAAVWPDPVEAAGRRFQDWREWIGTGLLDVVCPMAYTTDQNVFRAQIAAVKQIAGVRPVWAGIGAYRLSPPETVVNIEAARRLNAQGIVLFSYDNLTGGEYLPAVGARVFK